MSEENLNIQCPIPDCGKKATVKIPNSVFEKKKSGTFTIQIHAGICCEHDFIVFFSRDKQIRGYESIDMSIDPSKMEKPIEEGKVFLRNLIKKYGDPAIFACLHATLLGIPITFLKVKYEPSYLSDITKLFMDFLPDKYQFPPILVSYILDKEYGKVQIGNKLVISSSGQILHSPWSEIPMDFEKKALVDALEILDGSSQAIVIQQIFIKALEQADYVSSKLKKENLYEDELINTMKKNFSQEFPEPYMKLIKQIVQYRFKGDVNRILIRSFSKLKNGLW